MKDSIYNVNNGSKNINIFINILINGIFILGIFFIGLFLWLGISSISFTPSLEEIIHKLNFSKKNKDLINELELDFNSIEATGYGKTKKEATLDAQRRAIEKVSGVFVSSKTKLKEFCKLKDEIISKAEGYIEKYKEIEIESPSQNPLKLWKVTIKAKVKKEQIIKKIEKNKLIKKFLRRRVVIMIPKEVKDKAKLAGFKQLGGRIEEYLVDKGFRVFLQEITSIIFQQIANSFKDILEEKLFLEIKNLPADFIIFPKVEKRIDNNGNTFLKVNIIARNRIGKIFAKIINDIKCEIDSNEYTWEKAVDKIVKELNQKLYIKIINKISEIGEADEYRIHFYNYNEAEFDKIEDILKILPNVTIEEIDRGKRNMNVDIIIDKNPRKFIQNALDLKGIPYKWYSMGSWLFVVKPHTNFKVFIIVLGLIIIILFIIGKIFLKYLKVKIFHTINKNNFIKG